MTIFKIMGALIVLAIVGGAFFFLLVRSRLESSRKSSDQIIESFGISKPAKGLIILAKDLGFRSLSFKDLKSGQEFQKDSLDKLDQNSLLDIQNRIDSSDNCSLDIEIVPIPPFLRWTVHFSIENGVVKSVERLQLD